MNMHTVSTIFVDFKNCLRDNIETNTRVTFWYDAIYQCTLGVYTNGVPACVHPRGCTVHRLACAVQPRGHTGSGKVEEYCETRMLDKDWNVTMDTMLNDTDPDVEYEKTIILCI